MDAAEASGSLPLGPPVSTAARAPYRRHTLFGTTVSEGGDGAGNSTSWNGYISKAQAWFGGNSACLPHP